MRARKAKLLKAQRMIPPAPQGAMFMVVDGSAENKAVARLKRMPRQKQFQ
jgi:hypothetical protein